MTALEIGTERMDGTIVLDETIRARAPWSTIVAAGDVLRLVDLHGNQAIDCLLYRADDPVERYSAQDTFVGQRNVYLTEGTVLRTTEGRALMTITGTRKKLRLETMIQFS